MNEIRMRERDDKVDPTVELLKNLRIDHDHKDVKVIVNDGYIVVSENVLLKSNYFAKNLNSSEEKEINLPGTKGVVTKLFEYLSDGKLNIDGLSLVESYEYMDLLVSLEVDEAFKDIVQKHYKKMMSFGFPLKDYFVALDFTVSHNMDLDAFHIARLVTKNQNVQKIVKEFSEDFKKLSETAFLLIMDEIFDSTEIVKFKVFKKWFDANGQRNNLSSAKRMMRNRIDLSKFKVGELLGEVKKSKYFHDSEIKKAVKRVNIDLETKFYEGILNLSDLL